MAMGFFELLSLLSGLIIAVMVAVNGGLTQHHGVFAAAALIHLLGLVAVVALLLARRQPVRLHNARRLWLYVGGAIGVLTTVFNNFAFGKISLTSIVALGLFGQSATSLLIDGLGLFGMTRRPLSRGSLVGLLFSCVGMGVMLDRSVTAAVVAVMVSVAAGATVVLSRTANASLSQRIGALPSTLFNYLVGLPITVVLVLCFPSGVVRGAGVGPLWMYLGGALGVATVALCNVIVPRVPAFRLTLLTFVGQVLTGVALDLLTRQGYTPASLAGGLLVAAGVGLGLVLEHRATRASR